MLGENLDVGVLVLTACFLCFLTYFLQEVVASREAGGFEARALHKFAPSVDSNPLNAELKKKGGSFIVRIMPANITYGCLSPYVNNFFFLFSVKFINVPSFLCVCRNFCRVKADIEKTAGHLVQDALKQTQRSENPSNYVLRIPAREEYLLGKYKLYQYKCVRAALARGYEQKDLSDILVFRNAMLCKYIILTCIRSVGQAIRMCW